MILISLTTDHQQFFIIDFINKGEYEDWDIILRIFEFKCSDSLWADSVSFQIDGEIPLHQTENGKIEIGWRCGNNSKSVSDLNCTFYFNTNNGTQTLPLFKILDDEKACYQLREVVARFLSEELLRIQ